MYEMENGWCQDLEWQIALHPNTPIHWHAHIIQTPMDIPSPHLQEWVMMNQMEVPPSPPPSPLASPDRPRHFRFHKNVLHLPQNQPSHALEVLAFGSEVLPFPIFNFLTEEELMYSVEPQLNKLVITHFPKALKTLAVSVISCLGRVVLPPQYKIFLDPLSALRTSSASSQLGRNDPSSS